MNPWQMFGRCAGCAVVIGTSAIAMAGSFDSYLATDHVDQAAPVLDQSSQGSPVDSVLVQPLTMADDGHAQGYGESDVVVLESATAGARVPTGSVGYSSMSPEGTINRVLEDVRPRWEAQIDALMLWQGGIPSRVLFVDELTGAPALDANQAQPTMSAGPRFGLFLNLDPVYSIEGNYFNVQSFQGQAATPVGDYLENNLAGTSFGGISSASALTSGNIQSAELNWRRRTCYPITWLAGFRWVEWNEQMLINEAVGGAPAGGFTANTGNNLYGGQMGMDLCLWNNKTGPIKVNGVGKAGIFYNTAVQRTSADFGAGPTSAGAVADQTSFFGELGANATLRLTDWLSWRAGYTLFWLSGVATAANQLSTTNLGDPAATTINTNGSVLLHGVTTGLEARW